MNENFPTISIILPIYNKIQYLDNIFNDLIKQTFTDYECILIDDGSSDGSSVLCDKFVNSDMRFKVFHIENKGVSNARNLGMERAKGLYITFIDADDRLHIEYLMNLYMCICRSDTELVIGGYEKFWSNLDKKEYADFVYEGKVAIKDVLPNFAIMQKKTGIFGFCWSKIFKKDLTEGVRFDVNLKLAEDFDFYLRIYSKVNNIYFDNKPYYRYLQCAENSSSLVRSDQIDYQSQLKINLRYRQFLIDMEAFDGENKRIVEELIRNYVYFTIFYCKIDEVQTKCEELRKLLSQIQLSLTGASLLQRWLLWLLKCERDTLIMCTLFCYRKMRSLLKGEK